MTARHALTSLEREGLVVRRRGEGTFVAPPKIHFNKLMSYTEEMSRRSPAASRHSGRSAGIENPATDFLRKPTIYALGLYRSDRHTLFIRRFR